MDNIYHESVMVDEIVEGLHITNKSEHFNKGNKYIDATLGTGGHTLSIVKNGGVVLGIEMDPEMLSITQDRFKKELKDNKNYKLVQGNFENIDQIAKGQGFESVDGIIFDLGVSNLHLKDQERGFSFENPEALLDMRLDPEMIGVRASDLLAVLREDQLRELFEVTLLPGAAVWLSKKIVKYRTNSPILTVGDFIKACQGLKTDKPGLNPATLPFLALRIAVNSELINLKNALPKAFKILSSGGRLLVVSFHSKEDVIIKEYFKSLVDTGQGVAITYKPLVPSEGEINKNRRSRSAKLRIIEKI